MKSTWIQEIVSVCFSLISVAVSNFVFGSYSMVLHFYHWIWLVLDMGEVEFIEFYINLMVHQICYHL